MNLHIMRHGKAVERPGSGRDADRPLTAEGKRKTAQSAKGMKLLGLQFDVILSSPYTRARQTAEIVADVLKLSARLELTDALLPGASLRELVTRLSSRREAPEDVLLVGHEPMLGQLVSVLVAGDPRAGVVLKKGALCKLVSQELKAGRCARLEWLMTAKQMAALGRRA